jgi:hypothetical protein
MKIYFYYIVTAISCICISSACVFAEDNNKCIENSVMAVRKCAQNNNINPIPICGEEDGTLIVLGEGTEFKMRSPENGSPQRVKVGKSGRFVLKSKRMLLFDEGDLICNVCNKGLGIYNVYLALGKCALRESQSIKALGVGFLSLPVCE